MTAAAGIDGLRLLVADRRGFTWRLVAGNGRAVAASGRHFEHHADALAAFAVLCRDPEGLSLQFVHPQSTVAWTWNAVNRAGEVVASAERSYDRYGTCIAACRRFVATLRLLGANGAAGADALAGALVLTGTVR